MAEFAVQLEAIDKASPTIQKLSQEMIKAAKKSDRFADEIVKSSRRVDTSLKNVPPAAKQAAGSMNSLKQAGGQLQSQFLGFASIAGVIALFKSAADAALKEEEAIRRLAFAVNATGDSFESAKGRIVEFANAQQALTRFDDTATFETLGKILRVTGDVEQAMKATALAQDISASSGRDLNFVTEKLNELLVGEKGALLILKKEFGAFVGDAKTAQEALDRLDAGFSGAAAAEESFTKSLANSKAFLGDFSQKIGDGVLPVWNFLLKAIAFGAKTFEELGETIAFLAAKQFIQLEGAIKAVKAVAMGNFSEVKGIIQDTFTKTKAITEEYHQGIVDIEERFANKRVEIAKNETRLKAKQSAADAEKAKKTAQEKQKSEEAFLKKVQEINTSVMALRGNSFEAELRRIRTEQEAKIKALDDLFEKTAKTEELINEKRKATVLIEEEAARKIADARKKGLDDFNAQVKQSEMEVMELRGEGFEAEKERITAERDAKIEALNEAFEHTQRTTEQQFQLLEAQANINLAAQEKIAAARKENLDAFEKGAQQVTDKLVDETSDAVADMITEGKSFEEAWKSIMDSVLKTAIKTFTKIAIEKAIAERSAGGGFGGIAGGIGVGLFAAAAPSVLKAMKFQEGGIVRKPTLGLVGEAGPEAIIPLNRAQGLGNVHISVHQSNHLTVNGFGADQTREIMRKISDVTRSGASEGAELVKSILSRQGRVSREAV